MQRLFVPLLALMVSGFALAAADVTGTWTGTFTPENRDSGSALVILKQTGDTVTGTAGPDESERIDIVDGKLVGDTLTFQARDMKFVLKLDGENMNGQATRERDGLQQTAKLVLKREK